MTAPAVAPVCLLNGSLRGDNASSHRFLSHLEARLAARHMSVVRFAVRSGAAATYPDELFATLDEASAVVVACPLYVYCLPGGVMRFLEGWARYAETHPARRRPRLYPIVNCAFVVPETITEALRVWRHCATRLGLEYRFGLAIAAGPIAVMTSAVHPRLRRALDAIAGDIQSGSHAPERDVFIKPIVPRMFMDAVREFLDWRVQRDIRKSTAST